MTGKDTARRLRDAIRRGYADEEERVLAAVRPFVVAELDERRSPHATVAARAERALACHVLFGEGTKQEVIAEKLDISVHTVGNDLRLVEVALTRPGAARRLEEAAAPIFARQRHRVPRWRCAAPGCREIGYGYRVPAGWGLSKGALAVAHCPEHRWTDVSRRSEDIATWDRVRQERRNRGAQAA